MKFAQWQTDKLKRAQEILQGIIDKADGKANAKCGVSQEVCKELKGYIQSWAIPPIEDLLEGNR